MNKKLFLPVFLLMALVFGACGLNINLNLDQGSGHVITESRKVSGFDKVVINGIGDLTLVQGSQESLEIDAEDNVLPHIKTEVNNGTLNIGFDNKVIVPTKPVKFRLNVRDIHSLQTQGVSNIQSEQIKTDRLDIGIGGTGNINIQNLTANALTVNVSGAGNFTGVGQADSQGINLSGAGNYNGENLKSKTANITISGLGRVTTWVTDTLNVTISGTGSVDYYGNPQVSQQISGLGKLNPKGEK